MTSWMNTFTCKCSPAISWNSSMKIMIMKVFIFFHEILRMNVFTWKCSPAISWKSNMNTRIMKFFVSFLILLTLCFNLIESSMSALPHPNFGILLFLSINMSNLHVVLGFTTQISILSFFWLVDIHYGTALLGWGPVKLVFN